MTKKVCIITNFVDDDFLRDHQLNSIGILISAQLIPEKYCKIFNDHGTVVYHGVDNLTIIDILNKIDNGGTKDANK